MIVNEPRLRICPFCNSIALAVQEINFEKGRGEGYKPICQCGWAARQVHRWYSNRMNLINDFNDMIKEVPYVELDGDTDDTILSDANPA